MRVNHDRYATDAGFSASWFETPRQRAAPHLEGLVL